MHMKIKVLWGFCGDVDKLGPDTNGDKASLTRAGQVFENVESEYAHTLIGKALVQQLGDAAPAFTKPATPPVPSEPGPTVTLPAPSDTKVVAPATTSAAPAEGNGESTFGAEAVTGEAGKTTDTTTGAAAVAAAAELGTDAEKTALIAELEAAGATFDRRWGVAKLAEALRSAQGAKAD
jgi:hypothetical protein